MLCLLHHLYIYVITCAYSHIVYTKKSAKIINFLKTQKNPKKPNKTQKNPTPTLEKVRLGYGFFGLHPPPPPPPIARLSEYGIMHTSIILLN